MGSGGGGLFTFQKDRTPCSSAWQRIALKLKDVHHSGGRCELHRKLFSLCLIFCLGFLSVCARWSSRQWTQRAMLTCRGLWSPDRKQREESTPSTRPLFSNIHPPCPLLCVCAFQKLPCIGARPRSWVRATHAAASPHRLKNKYFTPRPLPVSPACPLHDDDWRCVLFFFLLSQASSSCLQGYRMTFEPRVVVHF